mgnify:CR=1 FL=1
MHSYSVTDSAVQIRHAPCKPMERTMEATSHRREVGTGRSSLNKQTCPTVSDQFLLTLVRVLGVWTT